MFSLKTLKNGLRIVTVPIKNTKTVTVLVVVETGSEYETKKNNGISHVLEHMFFKGTLKRPDTQALATEIDRIGGEHNAFTSKEITGYYAKAAASNFDLLLDVIADTYLNSKLDAVELEREKGVIIEEINMYQDIPMQYVGILFEKLLYGDQPAGWPTIGSKENVQGLNRQNLLDYLKDHYVSQNTVVFVAGEIDSQKAEKAVEECFAKIIKGEKPSKSKVDEKQDEAKVLLMDKKTDQTHFCLGARGYSAIDPDYWPAQVLTTILGGGMSSRLFLSVRERNGLAYYIHTNFETYADHGYLVTQAGVDNLKLQAALKLILAEFKKIKEEEVGADELKKAKEYMKGKLILDLETSDDYAFWLAGQLVTQGKIEDINAMLIKIDQVDVKAVLKVANDIFKEGRLNLALIGPGQKEEDLKKILRF